MSSVRTRNAIESGDQYREWPEVTSVPKSMELYYQTLLNKPYFVGTFAWSNDMAGAAIYMLQIPTDLLTNDLVKVPFNTAAKFRAQLCILLQVAGTPQHQGVLLAAAMPYNTQGLGGMEHVNSMLQAPHVFMAANEATPICLEVPFYANTKLLTTTHANAVNTCREMKGFNNYATVCVRVINGLVAPTGGSTQLTVSVHACFTKLEFYMPVNRYVTYPTSIAEEETRQAQVAVISPMLDGVTGVLKKAAGDAIDLARGALRLYTGLHNSNVGVIENRMIPSHRNFSNNVDVETRFEKLDPYVNFDRIVNEPVFNTMKDEMLISHIISKPQYIATFKVTTSTTGNSILYSRPITPFQETNSVTPYYTTPLAHMAWLSRYWRGGFKVHIQSSMTGFHYAKLAIVRDYSRDIRALQHFPLLTDISNLPYDTLEFSNGGQVQTVTLPYCSAYDHLPCDPSFVSNAMQHGVYYIALLQPLVTNGSVSTSVNFNVYISADDDFQYYGYGVNRLHVENEVDSLLEERDAQAQVLQETSSQDAIKSTPIIKENYHESLFRPIVSARDHIRRFNIVNTVTVNPETLSSLNGVYQIRLTDDFFPLLGSPYQGPSRVMRAFYFGNTGGYKIKVSVSNVADCKIAYVPPLHLLAFYPESSTTNFTNSIASVRQGFTTAFMHPLYLATSDEFSPCPFIESSSAITETSYVNDAPTPVNSSACRNMQFEFTIPQMNGYEFVGDSNTVGFGNNIEARTDIGYLVLSTYISDSIGSAVYTTRDIKVSVAIAYADEARFGFQVLSPVLRPELVLNAGSHYFGGPYSYSHTDGGNSIEVQHAASLACYATIT